ncbi:MAG TPA: hypothetical protein VHB79_27200 [Polyangiaceae bacterium]|nr:hypothetical protein [Polyangiaceae bacterium]
MDPEILKVMTDPEARKDPQRVRAAMEAMRSSARESVLSSVRTNSLVMGSLGYLMLAGALVVAVLFALGLLPKEGGMAALLLAPMGGLFVFFARYTALPSRALLRNGTAYSATIVEVRGLGRSIGIQKPGISATLTKITVELSIPQLGPAGASVVHSEYVLGGDFARLQKGATIPVRCDPKQPTRLAFDWDA